MIGIGCKSCRGCSDRSECKPFRGKLREYPGIRYTADGFDCALPVAIDSHSTCSFRCMYCFSNYLMRDPNRKAASGNVESSYKVGQWSHRALDRMLSGNCKGHLHSFYRTIMELGGGGGRRGPVQWGALGDPFDNIERQQGWGLEAMKIFEKYDQPVRIGTKGAALLLEPEYLKAFSRRPELYWITWSCISIDDEVLGMVDKGAPPPSIRLKAMKALAKIGVTNVLRMRPILPGISDRTPKYKHAWRDLIRAWRDAGAVGISMEFAFVPGVMPKHVRHMWKDIENVCGIPITKFYKDTTSVFGACLRSSRAWKEDLTLAIYEEAKKLGMYFGISDPHWKELNDFGCCCAIPPDHPVFGHWQRENATNALVRARQAYEKGKVLLVSAKDGIPEWSKRTMMASMVCTSGARGMYKGSQLTWADKLRETWNNLKGARGPLGYFEGVLVPVKRAKNGDILYKYQPPARRDKSLKVPYLHV